MAILGAHLSVSGGFHKAVESAAKLGMDCVQVFTHPPQKWPQIAPPGQFSTKNNNQWRAKPITDDEAERFVSSLRELGVGHPLSHSSYLINVAAPDTALWAKSVEAFVEELRRADRLEIPYVVLHPGAFTTADEATGLKTVIRALDEVHRQTTDVAARCLLETTAGQGTCLGCSFDQLATILDGVRDPDRLGVCFDTCHVFAAGYPLGTKKEYQETLHKFDATVGLTKLKAFHLNDSKRELGSRVDRHEHIGQGHLGLEPFRLLLNDERFQSVPMYLETPKGDREGESWDAINLRTLRELVGA